MSLKVADLAHWTLVSRDIPRTMQFYGEVLGGTPLNRGFPAGVRLGNTTIDFFPAMDDQQPLPGSLGQHHAYNIQFEDYDDWVEHLQAHEVPCKMANHGSRLMSIYTQDPDGYHIELVVHFDDPEQGKREIEKRGIARYSNPGGPADRQE